MSKKDKPTTEDLVTIASFFNPVEAQIVKGMLESEGIDCFLANDVVFTVNPGYALADGGVHLRVRESDAVRARELLSEEEE